MRGLRKRIEALERASAPLSIVVIDPEENEAEVRAAHPGPAIFIRTGVPRKEIATCG